MADILYECAKSFDKATKYNYIFDTARSNKKFIVNLSCLESEFTHIVGLDHLHDIKMFSTHSLKIKASTFQRILSKEIKFSDISQSKHFNETFPNTYNSSTKAEYTLTERISVLQDIEKILDMSYTGKLYHWKAEKANVKMPDGKIRHLSIKGDYMLVIPSEANPNEKIYLFLYRDRVASENKNAPIRLHLFSAFADCLDLSQGQERPFTILKEQKKNAHTNKIETLYISPSYKSV